MPVVDTLSPVAFEFMKIIIGALGAVITSQYILIHS
jgi:hypothetical protein